MCDFQNLGRISRLLNRDALLNSKRKSISNRVKELTKAARAPPHKINPDLTKEFANRYQVLALLGKGRYAEVNLAIDRDTGQRVAVKTYKKKELKEEFRFENLRREQAILTLISHPKIMKLLDVYEDS
jgi:serine/threonine protein kinase